MRILFTRFPLESAHGGAEVQTLSLMKGLAERGHAAAFIGSCPVLLEETERCRILNGELEIGPPPVTKWNAVSFFWRKKVMQERLTAALAEFGGVDAIVMLSLSEKLLLTEHAVAKGIKVFWLEHDRVGRWLTKNPWLPLLRRLSMTATTICVSELSRKIYLELEWKPERVVAIPNGIETPTPNPSPIPRFARNGRGEKGELPPLPLAEHGEAWGRGLGDGGNLHIGCVARLSQEKGVDLLIRAVGRLPSVELTIVGKGPDEGYLRQLTDHIHRAEMVDRERIRILPHVEDLASFYGSIDALVLPSRDNDPFGLVAAEAMSCGTPVIVTDQCGIAGYLTDGKDAIVVRADSDEELQKGILRLEDPGQRKRISESGKTTAAETFSLQTMIGAYERLIIS